jgi:hypothetical protein
MSTEQLSANPQLLLELSSALAPSLANYYNYTGTFSGGSVNLVTLLNQNVNLKSNIPCLIQVSTQINSTSGNSPNIHCNATVGGVALTPLIGPFSTTGTGVAANFFSYLTTPSSNNPVVDVNITPDAGKFIGADAGLWTVSISQ